MGMEAYYPFGYFVRCGLVLASSTHNLFMQAGELTHRGLSEERRLG